MKKIKQILALLLLLAFTLTGFAQTDQDYVVEKPTVTIENIYKNITCSNQKKFLKEQGFKYDRMLKIEETKAYIYSLEDDNDVTIFLYCYKNEALHMTFNMAEDVFTEAKNTTTKDKEFKKIKQTSEDTFFTKGSYTYIFSNKNHSIAIRLKTRDDN